MTERRQLPTNKFGDKDHHGALINAQVVANQRRDQEEREIKSMSIQQYRSSLDKSLQQQKEKLQHEMIEKQRLGDEFKTRQQNIMKHEEQAVVAKKAQMRSLSLDYEKQMQNKKEIEQVQREKEILAERSRIQQNELAAVRYREEQKLLRKYQAHQEKGAIKEKQNCRLNQRKQSLQEKLEDQKKISDNIEKFAKRDRDYADFYNRVSQSIDKKMNFFKPNVHSEINLVQRRDHAVKDDEQKYQQLLQQKQEQEEAIRVTNSYNTKDALHHQMREKEQRKERERQERRQETLEMHDRVRACEAYDKMLADERAQRKIDYNQRLSNQIDYKNFIHVKKQKMAKPERVLNRSLIHEYTEDKPTDFFQVPGAHPRISPLKASLFGRNRHQMRDNYLNRSMDGLLAPQQMESRQSEMPQRYTEMAGRSPRNSQEPRIPNSPRSPVAIARSSSNYFDSGMEKHRAAQDFEFAFNGSRHNPLINPIGDLVPKPSPGISLHRGKGSDHIRVAGARYVY